MLPEMSRYERARASVNFEQIPLLYPRVRAAAAALQLRMCYIA